MPVAVLNRVLPYVIAMALAVFFYILAGYFDVVSQPGSPGPDLWPRMVCVLLGVTSLIGMIGALFEGPAAATEGEIEIEEALSPPETNPELVWIAMATVGLYVLVLPHLGFFVATIFLTMALLVIGGMRRWVWVPATGFGLTCVFTFIFLRIVYVALPLGEGWFRVISLTIYKVIGVH